MGNCSNCGASLGQSAIFCSVCGAHQQLPAGPVTFVRSPSAAPVKPLRRQSRLPSGLVFILLIFALALGGYLALAQTNLIGAIVHEFQTRPAAINPVCGAGCTTRTITTPTGTQTITTTSTTTTTQTSAQTTTMPATTPVTTPATTQPSTTTASSLPGVPPSVWKKLHKISGK